MNKGNKTTRKHGKPSFTAELRVTVPSEKETAALIEVIRN